MRFVASFVLLASVAALLPATGCAARLVVAGPPPAPLVEVRGVAPLPGYLWVGGHWAWRGGWAWLGGSWVRPPFADAVWVPGHWVARGGGWVWIQGRWRR